MSHESTQRHAFSAMVYVDSDLPRSEDIETSRTMANRHRYDDEAVRLDHRAQAITAVGHRAVLMLGLAGLPWLVCALRMGWLS